MKEIRYNFCVLLLVAIAASCTNREEEAVVTDQRDVRFVMHAEIPGTTRTLTDADLATTFTAGDEVGLFAYKRAEGGGDGVPVVKNACYSFDGKNWKSATGQSIKVNTTEALNYYAYYPYTQDAADYRSISHQVKNDQSVLDENAKAYCISDLLTVKNTEVAVGSDVVGLIFNHALALVQVRLAGSDVTDVNATVTLKSMKTQAKADLTSDNMPETLEVVASDIKMLQFDKTLGNMVYRAVVPSQAIAAGTRLVEVEINNRVYAFSNGGEAFTLNPKKVRTVNIVLGEAGDVNFGPGEMTISKWESDEPIEVEPMDK